MKTKIFALTAFALLTSVSSFAGTYDCEITKETWTDVGNGKYDTTSCGKVSLSSKLPNKEGLQSEVYLPSCDELVLSFDDMTVDDTGHFYVSFTQHEPGRGDLLERKILMFSGIQLQNEQSVPSRFTLRLGRDLNRPFRAKQQVVYLATCTKR